jgi:hypothetical protein
LFCADLCRFVSVRRSLYVRSVGFVARKKLLLIKSLLVAEDGFEPPTHGL